MTPMKKTEEKDVTITRYGNQLAFTREDYTFLELSLVDDGALEINMWPGDYYGICEFLDKDCVDHIRRLLHPSG